MYIVFFLWESGVTLSEGAEVSWIGLILLAHSKNNSKYKLSPM